MKINQHLPSDLNPTRVEVKRLSLGDMVAQYTQADRLAAVGREKAAGKRLRALKRAKSVRKRGPEASSVKVTFSTEISEADGGEDGMDSIVQNVSDLADSHDAKSSASDVARDYSEANFVFATLEDAAAFCEEVQNEDGVTGATLYGPDGDEIDPMDVDTGKSHKPKTKSGEGNPCWVEVKVTDDMADPDRFDDIEAMLDQFDGTSGSETGNDNTVFGDFDNVADAQAYADAVRDTYPEGVYVNIFDKETGENLGKSHKPKTKSGEAGKTKASPEEWSVWVYWRDNDQNENDDLEGQLEDLASEYDGESEGSGSDGTTRDASFTFPSEDAANQFRDAAREVDGVKKVDKPFDLNEASHKPVTKSDDTWIGFLEDLDSKYGEILQFMFTDGENDDVSEVIKALNEQYSELSTDGTPEQPIVDAYDSALEELERWQETVGGKSHRPKTKSNPSFDEPISIAEEWASEDSDLADTLQDFIDALEADDLEAAQTIFSESLKDSGSPYASRLEDALGSASEVAVGDDSDSDYA